MKLAIMQPYFFPYIGYFQLINAVDKFVIYGDGKFRKRGWINRNRILINGKAYLFSVPLSNASCNRPIRDTPLHELSFEAFKARFLRQLRHAYANAPQSKAVMDLVERVLCGGCRTICDLATASVKSMCQYVGIGTALAESTPNDGSGYAPAQDRIIDICRREGAAVYVNLPSGTEFYDKSVFADMDVELLFLKPKLIRYSQFHHEFVPWLSIIDVLMFNPVEVVRAMLDDYELS